MIRQVEHVAGIELRLSCGHRVEGRSGVGDTVACSLCDARTLPDGLVDDRATPSFDATTVPKGLLRDHHTTTWAELVVTEGVVRLIEEDPPFRTEATPGKPAVLVPNRRHRVEPSPDAVFHVQFHRRSASFSAEHE